jgi:Flp pilus assembly protein TadG
MSEKLRLPHDDSGQGQVEFAISIMVVLVVIFMTMELCSAIYTYVVLSDAANEGVRYAIVNSSDDGTGTQTKVTTYAANSLHDMSAMTVSVTYPDGHTIPGRVRVTISYPYLPYLSLLTAAPTMHAYAEGRMVY